ncbi:streptomycin biosynthesis protein [Kibdelosporangium aridum]|uniref:streptomycin biosynthesis protein n=1 Tax=Kibdelosporangium aridum TaxID=2030 RepID=UPI0035EC2C4F
MSDSPRVGGEDAEHARQLAELDVALPPIIVHRPTMRVVDGMHRVRASLLRGDDHVNAYFIDGSEADAFVLAVKLNARHGLPLSQIDRASAAARILRSHPQWSDRAIASITGLATRTIASMRRTITDDNLQLTERVGRDGRVRPLNTAERRRRARDLIAARPTASLREIAKEAGISPGTVRSVRERIERGEDPVPPRQRASRHEKVEASAEGIEDAEHNTEPATFEKHRRVVEVLKKDPALRHSAAGRTVLRLLDAQSIVADNWEQLVAMLPDHCVGTLAEAAESCADAWRQFAKKIEERGRTES